MLYNDYFIKPNIISPYKDNDASDVSQTESIHWESVEKSNNKK